MGPQIEPKLPLEELLKCFLCHKDFNILGQDALLAHFSEEHYRLELEHNYITRPGMMWTTDKRCPKCLKIVESKENFLFHIGVEHRSVEEYLPEKYKLPKVEPKEISFPCPLKDCSSEKETKKALLVHLLTVHYQKDMDIEFGDGFRNNENKKCPKCKMTLLDNYLGYMKHIAVEHAHVMNFVERDLKENKDTVKETQDDSLNIEKHQVKENKDIVKETHEGSLNIEKHQVREDKDMVKETQDDSLNIEEHLDRELKDTVKETQDDYLNIEKHQDEENIESNEKQMHSENFNENHANSDISSLLGSEDSQQKNVSTEKPTNSNSTEIEKVAEAVANLQEKDNKTVRFIDSDPKPPLINPFFFQ